MKQNNRVTRRPRISELCGCVSLLALLAHGAVAQAQEATPVPDISVTAPPQTASRNSASTPLMDGSAEAGYRVKDTTAAGPIWGDKPIQDTPYSVSVVPSALIENLQAYQPEDIWRVIPQITNNTIGQNSNGNPFAYVRGFPITQFTNQSGVTYDGLLGGAGGMFDTTLEDKERVELLSGTSGFLYGNGSIGGVINNVLKRPTATPYYSVTGGDNAGRNGFVHGDFGGPINVPGLKEGLLGYRLNVVYQGGNTSITNQTVTRNLVSAAFDVHLWDGALLQFNAAHSNYYINGLTPAFGSSLVPRPTPADPSTVGMPAWLHFSDESDNGGAKFTWKLNDTFTFRSAYDYTYEARQTQQSVTNTITNYLGAMTTTTGSTTQSPNYWHVHSGYSFLDTRISTFGVEHKLIPTL